MFNVQDPSTWPVFRPCIIAHDVGRSHDRSTAVVGGPGPFQPTLVGGTEFEELPRNQFGSARASALYATQRAGRPASVRVLRSHWAGHELHGFSAAGSA